MKEFIVSCSNNIYNTEINNYITINLKGSLNETLQLPRFDQILVIFQGLPSHRYKIIYNGIVLNDTLSFSFYGISDNSTFFIVEEPSYLKKTNELAKKEAKSRYRQEKEEDRIRLFRKYSLGLKEQNSDPLREPEVARLNDLFRGRLESNPSIYRKICSRFNQFSDGYDSSSEETPTVLPDKAQNPSTDLLPIWDEKTSSSAYSQN